MIILSLLIPVIPKHYPKFMKLLGELQRQVTIMHSLHSSLGLVEILFCDSPSVLDGGGTIGSKRNELRMRAVGKYSAFIDADDNVAPNYVETLVRLCGEDKDVVSFNCIFKNDNFWSIINMSLENKEDEQVNPEVITKRKVWHVCAIRTEITRKENFDDMSHGEDVSFMNRIMPHLQSEVHTNLLLTQYNHSESESEADKIVQAGFK